MPVDCSQTPHQSLLSGSRNWGNAADAEKKGKRAGVLIRLRRRAFRPPLPTILLANVQSLDNKLCELRARISYQRETRDCCVICLTETWMSAMVPDSAIELTGFSVHRSDRTKELTGKSRGGGVCFYINNLWCDERNIHSIKSFCSPDLEFHMLLCRPFWLPREFTAIIINWTTRTHCTNTTYLLSLDTVQCTSTTLHMHNLLHLCTTICCSTNLLLIYNLLHLHIITMYKLHNE